VGGVRSEARFRRRRLLAAGAGLAVLVGGGSVVRSARPDERRAPPQAAHQQALPSPTAPATTSPTPRPVIPSPASSDRFTPDEPFLLRSKVQSQLPALPNGCEVTSLSMLLSSVGQPVSKMTLAREQETDPRQPVFVGRRGNFLSISRWGDPNRGFVGNVYGAYGYGIYHAPLTRLLDRKVPGRARDLTGVKFSDVLARAHGGTPVLLWTTTTFRPTRSWVTWQGPDGPVRATSREHAVVLVGATGRRLIVDNPLSGRRELVEPAPFIAAWKQLGRQALTVSRSA